MLRSVAITRIQRRLGFRKDLSAAILDELGNAQEIFERGIPVPIVASAYMGRFLAGGGSFLPWFLRSEITSINTIAGEERVPVPEDFIREYDDDGLYFFNPNADTTIGQNQWCALKKDAIAYNRMRYGSQWPPTTNSMSLAEWNKIGPQAYSLDGKYFRIFPLPNDCYTLRLIYYAHDAVIDPTDDGTNKWFTNAPNILIGEAGYQVAASARDNDRMQYFEKMRDEALARAYVDTIGQDAEGSRYVMGRDD